MPDPVAMGRSREAHETVAIVHHANQYVIGDGYSDRQGMTEILGLRGAISHPAGFMRAVRELQQTSIAVSAPLAHRNGIWLRGSTRVCWR